MISDWEIALRLLIAAGLGSLIGFARERLMWAAGIRTHMLVCVGTCLVMIVSAFGFSDIMGTKESDKMAALTQRLEALPFVRHVNVVRRNDVTERRGDSVKLSAP